MCSFVSWSRNLGDDVDGRGRSFPLISLNVDHRLQVPKMATALELGVIAVAHLLLAGGLSQSEVWYVRTMQSVFAWLSIRWISLKLETMVDLFRCLWQQKYIVVFIH